MSETALEIRKQPRSATAVNHQIASGLEVRLAANLWGPIP